MIKGIVGKYPDRMITVLCGLTHSGANGNVRVGRSRPGFPEIQKRSA